MIWLPNYQGAAYQGFNGGHAGTGDGYEYGRYLGNGHGGGGHGFLDSHRYTWGMAWMAVIRKQPGGSGPCGPNGEHQSWGSHRFNIFQKSR